MNDDEYRTRRRPVLEKAGIDPRAIEYLIRLERGIQEAVVSELRQLRREAVWPGRIATAPDGTRFRHDGTMWRLVRS